MIRGFVSIIKRGIEHAPARAFASARALAFMLALAVLLGGCGGDGNGETTGPNVSASPETASSTTPSDSGVFSKLGGAGTDDDADFEGFSLLPEHALREDGDETAIADGTPPRLEGLLQDEKLRFPMPEPVQAGLYNVVLTYANPYGNEDVYAYLEYSTQSSAGTIGNLLEVTDDAAELDLGELDVTLDMESIGFHAASDSHAEGSLMDFIKLDFILLEADETAVGSTPRETMTDALADEIYTYMQSIEFERYWSEFSEDWAAYTEDERTALLQSAMDFAAQMGLSHSTDMDEAMESMEWIYGDPPSQSCLWYEVCIAVGIDYDDIFYYNSVYFYRRGLENGDYPALHSDIMAATSSLIAQYHEDTPQLCTGTDSNVTIIYGLTEDGSFYQTGSLNPADADSIFDYIDYSISIDEYTFTFVTFGEADLLPALQGIGAADENGVLAEVPVQICASDDYRLFLLHQDEDGVIHITTATYDDSEQMYVWDENAYSTSEMACFNNDGDFCYIDESGSMQVVDGGR